MSDKNNKKNNRAKKIVKEGVNTLKENYLAILIGVFVFFGIVGFLFSNKAPEGPSFSDISSDGILMGKADAPVKIIQYSDFLCPHCAEFSQDIFPKLKKDFIDTGKVRYEFRPMAYVSEEKEGSKVSALGVYCANDQGKFFEYQDNVYKKLNIAINKENKHPKRNDIFLKKDIKNIAKELKLNEEQFNTCLDDEKYSLKLQEIGLKASKHGVTGVPYILVNGHAYASSISYSGLKALIEVGLNDK